MAFTQITRGALRGLLDNQLDSAASIFWRTDEKNRIIQDALRTWNALTGYWKAKVDITPTGTVANQAWYTLPGTMVSSMRVTFNGVPLSPSSLKDLDYGRVSWESETTASGGDVPTTPKLWAPAGLTLIAIWPADAVGGNDLQADGIATTPILSSDTSTVDIDSSLLDKLVDYMQHLAVFKEGGKEFESSVSAVQDFLAAAAERNSMLLASDIFRQWMGLDKQEDPMIREAKIGAR